MIVSELIALLQEQDPDRLVILQKDAEGNDHSPFADFWVGAYRPATTWHGEAGLEKLTPYLESHGYSEEDVLIGDDVKRALFLVPVN